MKKLSLSPLSSFPSPFFSPLPPNLKCTTSTHNILPFLKVVLRAAMAATIYTKGYLASSRGAADLARRLEATLTALRSADQESQPPGLDNVAAGLVLPALLHSKVHEVALLTCCCLADVLRLYAPDAPYNDDQKLVRALFGALTPLALASYQLPAPLFSHSPKRPPSNRRRTFSAPSLLSLLRCAMAVAARRAPPRPLSAACTCSSRSPR